jgi:DNA-binding transcriptional regulator YdaS (Cro superfamily)
MSIKRLSTKEAAAMLGFSASTLRQWRKGRKAWEPGLGPRFYSINRRIFYTQEALEDWEHLCGSRERQQATAYDRD